MKNYEAIQKMSIKEMAAVFYMFLKPWIDTKEDTAEILKNIEETLNKEVTDYGLATSEKQS